MRYCQVPSWSRLTATGARTPARAGRRYVEAEIERRPRLAAIPTPVNELVHENGIAPHHGFRSDLHGGARRRLVDHRRVPSEASGVGATSPL